MTQDSEPTFRVRYTESLSDICNHNDFRTEPFYGTISQAVEFCALNKHFRTPSAKDAIAFLCTIYEDEKRTPALKDYLDNYLPKSHILADEHTYEHEYNLERYLHFKLKDPQDNEKLLETYNLNSNSKNVDLIKFCLHDEETYELLLCRLFKSSKKMIKIITPNNVPRRQSPAPGIVSILDSNERIYYSVVTDPNQEGIVPLVLRKS